MLDNQTQFAKTLHGVNNATKIMLGASSYCYLDLTSMLSPEIFTRGKYPLHGVTVQISDFDEMGRRFKNMTQNFNNLGDIHSEVQTDIPIGELSPYHGLPMRGIALLDSRKPRDLDIFFTAFNGQWQEHVCLRVATNSVAGGRLAGSYLIRSGTNKLKEWTDGNFPNKADGTPDCHHVMPQDKPSP